MNEDKKGKIIDSMESDMVNMNERIEKLERIVEDKSNTHVAILTEQYRMRLNVFRKWKEKKLLRLL